MKNWTQVPAGEINGAQQRLWVAIGDNADEVVTRINTDPAFVANIARLMVNGGYEPSTSQKLAREIMRRLKAESTPRDWRSVWLAVEGAHRMARTTNEGSKS